MRSILEERMLDLMYELPDLDSDGARYTIDADVVAGKKRLADVEHMKKKESA